MREVEEAVKAEAIAAARAKGPDVDDVDSRATVGSGGLELTEMDVDNWNFDNSDLDGFFGDPGEAEDGDQERDAKRAKLASFIRQQAAKQAPQCAAPAGQPTADGVEAAVGAEPAGREGASAASAGSAAASASAEGSTPAPKGKGQRATPYGK